MINILNESLKEKLKKIDDFHYNEIIENNLYNIKENELINYNIIDIGANQGIFTLLANHLTDNKIISVEANPITFSNLKNNISNFSKDSNKIILINKAVYKNNSDKLLLVTEKEFSPTDGRCFVEKISNLNNNENKNFIETITLDDLISNFDNNLHIATKIDCEGSEYDIIYNTSFENLNKIDILYLEAHQDIYKTKNKKNLINNLKNYLININFNLEYEFDYIKDKVKIFKFKRLKKFEPKISVLISIFNRPYYLKEQLNAIENQTLKPNEIVIYQTKCKYKDSEIKFDIPENIKLIISEHDFSVSARYSICNLLSNEYIFLTDDDIIPGKNYFLNALQTLLQTNGIVTGYGLKYLNNLNNDILANKYGSSGEKNEEIVEVDCGGQNWFGRKEYFNYFYKEEIKDKNNADDIHFSYILKKYLDLKIVVAPHPVQRQDLWSNTNLNFGLDNYAIHTRNWEDEKEWKYNEFKFLTENTNNLQYYKKNYLNFIEKRKKIIDFYIQKGWKFDNNNKFINNNFLNKDNDLNKNKDNNVFSPPLTIVIPTKNRYFTTLPLTLYSIAIQNYKNIKKILILDDSDSLIDLRKEKIYQFLFLILNIKNIEWEVIFGPKKGQHYLHQIALEKAETDLILRIDDDEILEANTINYLIRHFENDKIGAVGGLVLDPLNLITADETYFNNNRIKDIFTKENTQWVYQKSNVFEVEHLYSTFLYRKVKNISYCLELLPGAFREETIFTYEYIRNGYKLLVDTNAITWHLRNPEGGNREIKNEEYWIENEKIFKRKLENWKININGKILINENGLGDNICFLSILPEILNKYQNTEILIASYYPFLYKDFPKIKIINPLLAKDILGEKKFEEQNVYKYLFEQKFIFNRKISLLDAYKEIFLENKLLIF